MTQEQELYFSKKLQEIDNSGALAGEFAKTGKLPTAEELEEYPGFTDRYDSYEDFIGDKNALLKKFYDSQNGKMPTEARLQSFIEKHPTVSAEDVNKWFTNVNKYKEEEIKAREDEAGKIRRAREIREDWSLPKKILTSGYEQERYIQDPKSATFGKEAPGFIGSSAGSKADLISGGIAAGADFVPGPVSMFVGPTIRAGRDVTHKIAESPYQKEWSDIGTDAAKDYGMNIGAYALANARKVARVARGLSSPEIQAAMAAEDMSKNVGKTIDILDNMPKNDPIHSRRIIQHAVPEGPMKNELLEASKNWKEGKIDWDEIGKIRERYKGSLAMDKDQAKSLVYAQDDIKSVTGKPYNVNPLDEAKLMAPDLTKAQKVKMGLMKGAEALNTGNLGQMVYQTTPSITGARSSKPANETKKPSFKEAKNWYKKNYERDFEMGFDPRRDINPDAAKIAAWEEWREEKAKKSGEIYDQWEAKAKELTR